MNSLPQETVGKILSFLWPPDLLSSTLVCRGWLVEANRVMKFGLLVDVGTKFRDKCESTCQSEGEAGRYILNCDEHSEVSPANWNAIGGIFSLLGHRGLTHQTRYSFACALTRLAVISHPRRILRLPAPRPDGHPEDRNVNHHPGYMVHPLGRRIFLTPVGDVSDVDDDLDDVGDILTGAEDDADDEVTDIYFEVRLDPRFRILPIGYAMRHHSSQDRAPRNWKLMASEWEEGDEWEVVREHVEDETMPKQTGGIGLWSVRINPSRKYRRFRVLKTGPSAAGLDCRGFHVSGLELYGKLYVERACEKSFVNRSF